MAWRFKTNARGRNIERLKCPARFQERITIAGGTNRFGEPNFRIVWGMTETIRVSQAASYKDMLVGFNEPCWILQRWNAPETYGTPDIYFASNYDAQTGRSFLGDYPWRGRYETLFPLRLDGVVNGVWQKEYLKLSNRLVNFIIPVIRKALSLSKFQQQQAVAEFERRKEEKQVKMISDVMQDATPAFNGAEVISFTRQGTRSSAVQQRMEKIETHWKNNLARYKEMGKGISQSNQY